jgi:hypothetical protein
MKEYVNNWDWTSVILIEEAIEFWLRSYLLGFYLISTRIFINVYWYLGRVNVRLLKYATFKNTLNIWRIQFCRLVSPMHACIVRVEWLESDV